MDQYSSGEDVVIKARKPYTITKQRERWTEEEHTRFLEALKLYGRAWQRIEEYIGTKTAVQIRSHAQKFFSKLEKEALVKGVANNQALDIDIPPPRPKRKPNNPYPRKTGSISPTGAKDGKALPSASSPCLSQQPLDLEKEPHFEKPGREEKTEKSKEYQDDRGSDVFMQEAASTSFSSANKNFNSIPTPLRNSYSIKGFVPLIKEVTQKDGVCQSYITYESKSYENMDRRDDKQKILDKGNSENSRSSNEKPAQTDETQSTQNYPRHVPVHILDGSQGTSYSSSPDQSHQGSAFDQLRGIYGLPHLFFNLPASATNLPRSLHQSFPNLYAPAVPMLNWEDDYRSCLQFSSAFSSLILSTLLQNPAAHAAASFAAATCWPSANAEASTDSIGGFPSQKVNQGGPSMVAIAAATVAAATAWWAANGLLPLCTSFHAHNGFTCAPSSTNADQSTGPSSGKQEDNLQDSELQDQPMEPDLNDDLQPQHSASNESPVLSSPDPDGSGEVTKEENKSGSSEAIGKDKSTITEMELNDSDKITKGRKPVDRSSCGSNTTSSSDVETDALKKHEKVTEASIEPETCNPKASHPMIESINRRGRFMSNVNDSWKEVSEEGRLAFQALFSQEVLPQSFTRNMKIDGNQKILKEFKHKMDDNAENASLLDLNCQTSESFPSHQGVGICAPDGTKNDAEDSLLNIGLGYGKQTCRTGFKPYKRCSVEAKEGMPSGSSQADKKGTKRIRLEEEAST